MTKFETSFFRRKNMNRFLPIGLFALLNSTSVTAEPTEPENATYAGYLEVSALSAYKETWKRSNEGENSDVNFSKSGGNSEQRLKTGGNLGLRINSDLWVLQMSSSSVWLLRTVSDNIAIGSYLSIDHSVQENDADRTFTKSKDITRSYSLGPVIEGYFALASDNRFEWSTRIAVTQFTEQSTETKKGSTPSSFRSVSTSNWSVSSSFHYEYFINKRISFLSGVGGLVRRGKYKRVVENGKGNQVSYTTDLTYGNYSLDILVVRVRF